MSNLKEKSMDSSFIEEMFNSWNVLFYKWKDGTPIYKDEVEHLLKIGQIPTSKGLLFLHAAFTDKVIYVTRPPNLINRPEFRLQHQSIVMQVLQLQQELNAQKTGSKKLSGEFTPRRQAKIEVAKRYSISERKVEYYLSKYEEEILKLIVKPIEYNKVLQYQIGYYLKKQRNKIAIKHRKSSK